MATKPHKIFSDGDGRIEGDAVLFVHAGEQIKLLSYGWDCDDDTEEIEAWRIPYIPANPECEEVPPATPYMERVQLDVCSTIDLIKVKLTKNRSFDIIDEPGVYKLVRRCGAEDVTVWAQTVQKQ